MISHYWNLTDRKYVFKEIKNNYQELLLNITNIDMLKDYIDNENPIITNLYLIINSEIEHNILDALDWKCIIYYNKITIISLFDISNEFQIIIKNNISKYFQYSNLEIINNFYKKISIYNNYKSKCLFYDD